MPKDFDVEDLKTRKIGVQAKPSRVHLPLAGSPTPPIEEARADIDEAFGGSETTAETVAKDELHRRVVETLRTIYDPEIPLNVYDLGLIYGITVAENRDVEIAMTLTAPACPVAGMIVTEVAHKVGQTAGARKSHVKLVWDPPWTKDRMSEDALLELGLL